MRLCVILLLRKIINQLLVYTGSYHQYFYFLYGSYHQCFYFLYVHIINIFTFYTAFSLTDYAECGPQDYRCQNNQCVIGLFVCDGEDDCGDGSDEVGCSGTCEPGRWKCPKSATCINMSNVCDGQNHCEGGEDEATNCSKYFVCLLFMYTASVMFDYYCRDSELSYIVGIGFQSSPPLEGARVFNVPEVDSPQNTEPPFIA